MTKRTRTFLFLSLVILFLLIAPFTVFYSLGWRFDWETKKIFRPGIFYFKVWPKSAEIYLNGELKKKTDFFFGSALIENLSPKKYDVEIRKEGFQVWKKSLEIKKGEVTEGKNIVLVPQSPIFTNLAKGVKQFFFSPDEKKIILKEEVSNSEDSENPSWSLKLFELGKNVRSHLIEEKNISKEEVQLLSLSFSSDSKKVLLKLGLAEKVGFYILKVDVTPPIITPLDFLPPNVQEVYFHPKNPEKLFALPTLSPETTETRESPKGQTSLKGIDYMEGLSEIDLPSRTISLPILKDIIAISFFDNDVYYLETSGFLFKNDLFFNREEKLNVIPFSLKEETKYKIGASFSYIVLKEGDTLYTFNKNKKIFEKLSEGIKGFRFCPDFKKTVYFNDYEIWVLFLEKTYDQPQKEVGDQLFLTRFSEKIDDVFWYTNHYLMFNAGEKIKIAEIDDRDRISIFDLAELKTPEIFWSQINKKLYVLSEENLYASEELVP
jgi:hypothetical protein